MAAATATLNAAINAVTALFVDAALGNSSPGTTGAGELSGGGYARQAIAWTAASSASAPNTSSVSWSVPASTSGIGWVNGWSALSAGTYITDLVLSPTVSFSSAGTLTAAAGALTYTASQSA